jgi:hypothetical protein
MPFKLGNKEAQKAVVSKVVTPVGRTALNYVRNPGNFPKETPDPREDAVGFAEFIKNLWKKNGTG